MAYNREKVIEQILKAIEKENITFFNDLEAYIEPSMSTLYEWELEKSETIKRAISINRINQKKKQRRNWAESDNATLQVASYKLIADDEELKRLTMNKVEHSGKVGYELTLIEGETDTKDEPITD